MTVELISEDPRTQFDRWTPRIPTAAPRLVDLPPMLVNVLDSLCEGKSNRAIGKDWGISEDTVKTHIKRLLAKLGARDRLHAVVLVLTGAIDVRMRPDRRARDWSVDPAVIDAAVDQL